MPKLLTNFIVGKTYAHEIKVPSPFKGSKIVILGENFAVTNAEITHLDVNILAST